MRGPRVLAVVLTGLALTADAPAGPPSAVRLTRDAATGVFTVEGLDRTTLERLTRDPSAAASLLRVEVAGEPGVEALPRLLGTYEVGSDRLVFRPRFPPEPGVRYRATLAIPGSPGTPLSTYFGSARPDPGPATTYVTRVAPSGDALPENLLRFYLEFSAPMSRGEAYEHIHLLDGEGLPMELPFLELGEELWDPSGTRFTLLFDPGRIKTGLKPREDAGPVLVSGKAYTLVVDRGWHDALGKPLSREFRKPFRAVAADTTPPDPASWRLAPPRAGTTEPLVVRFPEPLDRWLLRRLVTVADPGGRPAPGAISVGGDETSWSFTPEHPWMPGGYILRVGRDLEDRAGNGVGRPFEVDVFRQVDRRDVPDVVDVPFRVERGQ